MNSLGATDNLPVIAFMNPGGMGTHVAEGPVTRMQVANVQPFANTLETLDFTGEQIKQVLEEPWQPDGSSGPFLNDEPLDMTVTYRVVINNSLVSGGDNFFTLGQGANYADTGLVDLQAFVDYFKSHDVVYPDYSQRAVGARWVTGEDPLYAEGDEFEIDLSSLLFSTNEPKASTFSVASACKTSDAFIERGEIDVDDTLVDNGDEDGDVENETTHRRAIRVAQSFPTLAPTSPVHSSLRRSCSRWTEPPLRFVDVTS